MSLNYGNKKSFLSVLAAGTTLVSNPSAVLGHGQLEAPVSRNVLLHEAQVMYCPHCFQSGGPAAVYARAHDILQSADEGTQKEYSKQNLWPLPPGAAGDCGDPYQGAAAGDDPFVEAQVSGWRAGNAGISSKMCAGSVMKLRVKITAHHSGHFEFNLCDKAVSSAAEDFKKADGSLDNAAARACFQRFRLERVDPADNPECPDTTNPDCQPLDKSDATGPENKHRWYVPPITDAHTNHRTYHVTMRVPPGFSCQGDSCTLQWNYVTGNSCIAGYNEYSEYKKLLSEAGYNGELWNDAIIGTSWEGVPYAMGLSPCEGTGPGGWPAFKPANEAIQGSFDFSSYAAPAVGHPEQFWNCADIPKSSCDGSTPPEDGVLAPM